MLLDSFRSFAAERLRSAATEADAESAAPEELMAQSSELGITMLGVPEELGGVFEERSATTSVLIAETLAHGDMGLAVAALAPAAVSTAISLWGDADQQAKYLPPFVGDDGARRRARDARAAAAVRPDAARHPRAPARRAAASRSTA